ncbi:MAG: GreA/GreB family elongation factor, partial [Woeseiaceae bacterium]
RSENAEYIYRKKELAGIDSRIGYLQRRMPRLTVVRETPASDQAFFGARVTLARDDGREIEYRIVGADEADAGKGKISIDSPLARALLRKRVDDEVDVATDERRERFIITAIHYPN